MLMLTCVVHLEIIEYHIYLDLVHFLVFFWQ